MPRNRNAKTVWALADLMGAFFMVVTVMFLIAAAQMHPQSDQGNVKLRTQGLITLTWADGSYTDLDLWVRGPGNTIVGYPSKDGRFMHLDRDDLGLSSNTFTLNGQTQTVPQNTENISVQKWVTGEWVVNVHYYSGAAPLQKATIKVMALSPYRVIYQGTLPVAGQQEETFVSFYVEPDGTITDVRSDLQIPFRRLSQ